jgi:RNA polymerase sigma-70 factor (ECF subfamily)
MDPERDDETRELVDACRHGDRVAQHALYQRFVKRVHFIVARMVGFKDSDDVTQNVFLQVFLCLEQYRQQSRFETWLYRVTVNEALQYRRHNRRWPLRILHEELVVDCHEVNNEGGDRELLKRALLELPGDLRALFILREVEGLPYRDLAEILEMPEGTVASQLNRVRQLLRQKLIAWGREG